MARSIFKAKGRKGSGHFAAVPHAVITSPNFQKMQGNAVKLLVQMIDQLRFGKDKATTNNGDLCVSWTLMKEQGWKSKATLQNARDELIHYGFISLTRRGLTVVRGTPNLYAVTFHRIDECGGKLDVSSTSGCFRRMEGREGRVSAKEKIMTTPVSGAGRVQEMGSITFCGCK